MNEISIVIVTYNSSQLISDCIRSIYRNNDISDQLEIIVVDNNSSDIGSLRRILESEFPLVTLIQNTDNGGYGQGNNLGIERATSPIIMIMNPDVRLFKPIFRAAVKRFQKRSLDLLGMKQYETASVPGGSFHPKGASIITLILHFFLSRLDIYSSKLFFISGACFFVRKSSFEKIGLFDESIFMYGEETDINIRFRKINRHGIKYDRTLGYIHPMHVREISFATLKKSYLSYRSIYLKHMYDTEELRRESLLYYRLLRVKAQRRNDKTSCVEYSKMMDFLKQKDV